MNEQDVDAGAEDRATLQQLRKGVKEGKLHVERSRDDVRTSMEILAKTDAMLDQALTSGLNLQRPDEMNQSEPLLK